MKRMKYIALAIGAMSMIQFSSCMKESVQVEDPSSTPRFDKISFDGDEPTQTYSASAKNCVLPAVECLPGIVVTPSFTSRLNTLNAAIISSKVDVKNFFNTQDGESLVAIFGQQVIDGLQNGTYTMIRDDNYNDNIDHYLVGDYNNLTFNNPLITFPVSVN